MTARYVDHSLGEFLDLVAKRQPAPGGGAVAAVTVAVAASLVAMAARYSADLLDGGEALIDDAERLRAGAANLADDDAEAYGAVIAAWAASRGDERSRRQQVDAALTRAAGVALEVAELGAETARLAGRLAVEGKRDVRGDAATALLLAEAATRAAARLVAVNVETGGGDGHLVGRAGDSVAAAREAASCME